MKRLRPKPDLPFRGTFKKSDGTLIGLDFYATSRDLALDHAAVVARDTFTIKEFGGPLDLIKIRRLLADDVFDAGSFFPIVK